MPNRVLYFPYMSVPSSEWFTRVLLYWDEVGTIVPTPDHGDSFRVDDYTTSLIRERLLSEVIPEHSHLPALADGFLALLDLESRTMSVRTGDAPRTKLHISKMGMQVARELEDRGLAERDADSHSGFVYSVDRATADLFMAYLAVLLGQETNVTPVSDSEAALRALQGIPTGLRDSSGDIDRLQLVMFEYALPAPSRPIPAKQLRAFKEDNHEQLSSLRRKLEAMAMEVAGEPDAHRRQRRLDLVHADLDADIKLVVEVMEQRSWRDIVAGTLELIVGVGAAAGAVTAASQADIGTALLSTARFFTAVDAGLGRLRPNRDYLQSPLAYAAPATRTFSSQ